MILRRLGNKSKIAAEVQQYFPEHRLYIEPFFGAGGMFFNKPKAKHNIVNDSDSDVFNLFQVVSTRKNDLEEAVKIMPVHMDLLNYWKENLEIDPIRKAIRFIFLSNLTFLGKMDTLRFGEVDPMGVFFERLDKTFEFLKGVQFANKDFRDFFRLIAGDYQEKSFIYADGPYLGTTDNYQDSFTEKDSLELFECLEETGSKWAMSEFDHPFILSQARDRNLNIITIGERRNLNNRRLEILVTNYENSQIKMF